MKLNRLPSKIEDEANEFYHNHHIALLKSILFNF